MIELTAQHTGQSQEKIERTRTATTGSPRRTQGVGLIDDIFTSAAHDTVNA